MIPEKFIRTAEAEYFCNVSEFIGRGEGKKVSPREVCGIKNEASECAGLVRSA